VAGDERFGVRQSIDQNGNDRKSRISKISVTVARASKVRRRQAQSKRTVGFELLSLVQGWTIGSPLAQQAAVSPGFRDSPCP
jgi:hypothetical protein